MVSEPVMWITIGQHESLSGPRATATSSHKITKADSWSLFEHTVTEERETLNVVSAKGQALLRAGCGGRKKRTCHCLIHWPYVVIQDRSNNNRTDSRLAKSHGSGHT